MQATTRRRAATASTGVAGRNGVVAGTVCETRMKMNEVKGTIKVFNAAADEDGLLVYRRIRQKRRSWTSTELLEKAPIPLRSASDAPSAKEGNAADEEEVEIGVDDKEMDLGDEQPKSVEEKEVNKIVEVMESEKLEKPPPQSPPTSSLISSPLDLREMHPDPVRQQPSAPSPPPSPQPPPPPPPPPQQQQQQQKFFVSSMELEEQMDESAFENQNRVQSIVDLVMWRDISRSAFVFGFGAFFLLSSSYIKDLDFSLISAISYLGLIYLALIFLYKSILRRGIEVEYDDYEESYMLGEEEAIWVLRLLLPYINEVLWKIKALFSGDPATTMKLAVILFVMARCGSSITIWTLAKLVFFGIFTIPKVCSSYSVQLARYGKFWLERFRDGWESCAHKKAVAAAIFTIIWNLSSTVARIWAVFMLVVAVKFYQQCVVAQEWNEQDEVPDTVEEQENSKAEDGPVRGPAVVPGPLRRYRQRPGPSPVQTLQEKKLKKGF